MSEERRDDRSDSHAEAVSEDEKSRDSGGEHDPAPYSSVSDDESKRVAPAGDMPASPNANGDDSNPPAHEPFGVPLSGMQSLSAQRSGVLAGLWLTTVDELVATCATSEGQSKVRDALGLDEETYRALMDEARALLGDARFDALLRPAPEHPLGYWVEDVGSDAAPDDKAQEAHDRRSARSDHEEVDDRATSAAPPNDRSEEH